MSPTTPPTEQSGVFIISSDGRILQLPIPSRSPKDPLNWSLPKRLTALSTLFLFSTLALIQMQGVGMLLRDLETEYSAEGAPPFDVVFVASVAAVFMGIGAFIWVPLSLATGRRPVFLLCNLLLGAGTLYAAASRSIYHHLAARCIQGLAAGISASTIILMIIDLTFIHQRAATISLFWALGGVLSNALLVPVPQIIARFQCWRAFYIFWLPMITASFFLALFFCPETYFRRPPVAFDGRVLDQSSSEKVTIYENWEDLGVQKDLPDLPASNLRIKLRELKFWGAINKEGWNSMRAIYPQILFSFLNPLIFWVMVLNALVLAAMVSFEASSSSLLSVAPYNLSIGQIALFKLAHVAAAIIAFPASGLLAVRISRLLARRNGGKQCAEHHLPSFFLPIIFGFTATVLYGMAGQYHLPVALIVVANGLIFFSFISLFTSNTLWTMEVFPHWAAASLTVVVGGSYTLSFALSFAMNSSIKRQGFAITYGAVGGLIMAFGCIGVPIAIWGGGWRSSIQNRWGSDKGGALRPQ